MIVRYNVKIPIENNKKMDKIKKSLHISKTAIINLAIVEFLNNERKGK